MMIRRLALAALLALSLSPAIAQAPPPVPALPDAPRLTTYSITASNCACAVNMALYGNPGDSSFQDYVEVYLNGLRVNYNDTSVGWTITSPTGPLATIPRPVTDGILTFNSVQTGTVQIVGARRPSRTSQFTEGRGVAARDLNEALTEIVAQNRETWDKINDVTGRGLFFPPGYIAGPLPAPPACQGAFLGFDGSGTVPHCYPAIGPGPDPLLVTSTAIFGGPPASPPGFINDYYVPNSGASGNQQTLDIGYQAQNGRLGGYPSLFLNNQTGWQAGIFYTHTQAIPRSVLPANTVFQASAGVYSVSDCDATGLNSGVNLACYSHYMEADASFADTTALTEADAQNTSAGLDSRIPSPYDAFGQNQCPSGCTLPFGFWAYNGGTKPPFGAYDTAAAYSVVGDANNQEQPTASTISIASPAVVTSPGFISGISYVPQNRQAEHINVASGGSLPTGLTNDTTYYAVHSGYNPATGAVGITYELAATIGQDNVTGNVATSTFTAVNGTAPPNGYEISFQRNGVLPSNISGSIFSPVTYFVVNSSGATFKVALTSGGSPITLTGTMSGFNSIQWNSPPINTSGTQAGGIATFGAITPGSLYTATGTYLRVPLTGGTGTLATADITIAGGGVTKVVIVNPGSSSYLVGDTLSASNANLGGAGSGFSIPVASLGGHLFTMHVAKWKKAIDITNGSIRQNATGHFEAINLASNYEIDWYAPNFGESRIYGDGTNVYIGSCSFPNPDSAINFPTCSSTLHDLPQFRLLNTSNDGTPPSYSLQKQHGPLGAIQSGDALGNYLWESYASGMQTSGFIQLTATAGPTGTHIPTQMTLNVGSTSAIVPGLVVTPTTIAIPGLTSNGFLRTSGGTGTVSVVADPSDVTSVSNSDGTLTISPTTGSVVASLALGHANTWSGQQTFVAPVLGAATATSINGNTFTTGTYTLTGVAAKTLTFSNSLTLAGTDATTMTFPGTSATIARTDAGQTFTGTDTFASPVFNGLPTGTGVATANTASTLVARDGSGNFSAGTITASLTGNASLNLPLTGGTVSGATTFNNNLSVTASSGIAFHSTVPDGAGAYTALFGGTTRAVRFLANSGAMYIEGVDITGVASFQPIVLDGSTTTISTAGISAITVNGSQQSMFAGSVTLSVAASDAATTDATVCRRASDGLVLIGSGTLGICLGTSSARYKTPAGELTAGLPEIMALKPSQFYLDAQHGDPSKLMYGFYAEDMQTVLPKLVGLDETGRANTADYLGIVPVLVRGMQQMQAEIDQLRSLH